MALPPQATSSITPPAKTRQRSSNSATARSLARNNILQTYFLTLLGDDQISSQHLSFLFLLSPMASTALFRIATRTAIRPASLARATTYTSRSALSARASAPTFGSVNSFSTSSNCLSAGHEEETFDEFSARYEKEFDAVQDVFELQRNLNNAFAYDLVPSIEVLSAALRAARRVNDFPTAVRIFEGVKAKVENDVQYKLYLAKLENLRKELGVALREELYPNNQ